MVLVVTVARALAVEVVTLHATGEPLAAAHRGDVHEFSCRERVDGDFLTDGETVDGIEPQLDETTTGRHVGLGEVSRLGLGQLLRILGAVGDLQG